MWGTQSGEVAVERNTTVAGGSQIEREILNTSAVILVITGGVITLIALLPRIVRLSRGMLRVGDRIRLSGGCDSPPRWLDGREYVDDEVLSFVDPTLSVAWPL